MSGYYSAMDRQLIIIRQSSGTLAIFIEETVQTNRRVDTREQLSARRRRCSRCKHRTVHAAPYALHSISVKEPEYRTPAPELHLLALALPAALPLKLPHFRPAVCFISPLNQAMDPCRLNTIVSVGYTLQACAVFQYPDRSPFCQIFCISNTVNSLHQGVCLSI